jgi:hypothetical protein
MISKPARQPVIVLSAMLLAAQAGLGAQRGRGGQAATAPSSPRLLAPIDLTGYWVSIVTEDWAWRMVMPRKGDFASVPLNDEGRRVLLTWDPATDEANGDQCKSYGAPAILRVPGRLRVTWENDVSLKIETDAGEQTRVLHFGAAAPVDGAASRQGRSIATWESGGGRERGGRGGPTGGGTLKVTTNNLEPGYLRRNGVPYSENTVVTEYFDRFTESTHEWFTVTTIVEDPTYLTQPFITSSNFRKEPDGSKWRPVPCTSR